MKISDYRLLCSGPVVILGNGPSLNDVEIDRIRYPTMGLNRSYLKTISPYHVGVDKAHAEAHLRGDLKAGRFFSTWRLKGCWDVPGYVYLGRRPPGWWSCPENNSDRICGYAGTVSLELAVYMGFNPIIFVALDLHGPKFYDLDRNWEDRHFKGQRARMGQLSRCLPDGVEVFNCSPITVIKCFPYLQVEEIYGR
jgi:hypothetical protein